MIALKDYQVRVLDDLQDFFRQCSKDGRPEGAYQAVQIKNGIREPIPYLPVSAAGLAPGMPYVCVRVPTGGGKTLLACHAVGIAMKELLHADKAVALWLVPNTTILDQTADALRDKRHPYRRAFELSCGEVEVLTIEEALNVSRATVEGRTVVIVSTIQCFRVEETIGRKVYAQNGRFDEHMLNLPPGRVADLIPGADGKPSPSLVNMLRLRRPIVIVDEAHNVRTDLSFSTLGTVLPSCIVEFTATPARSEHPSNVLHHCSAAELKAADMVKLPLRVVTRHPGQRDQLLAEAVALRSSLEKLAEAEAQKTGEYLRPIMLIQADRVDDCEPLRERLIQEFKLVKEQIKISVGSLDELKDISDISAQACPIRFVITVQKLREGWDCPFAYVLCSLKETRSPTAIEQIAGRILRLPGATAKQHPDLNCAYAFSVSDSITAVLAELRQALESNGFTAAEAERIILPVPQGILPLGVQPQTMKFESAEIDRPAASSQAAIVSGKVRLDEAKGEITVLVPLDEKEESDLVSCLKTENAKWKFKEAASLVRAAEVAWGGTGLARAPTPYERQLDFVVPLLCVSENGTLFEFESTFLLEHPWKLGAKDASLPTDYDPRARPAGKAGQIDVVKGKLQSSELAAAEADFVATLHQQVLALGAPGDWTLESLVVWLDYQIDHKDIPPGESAEFLRKAVRGLMARLGIEDIGVLALDRFRLKDEIERRIEVHRQAERKAAFQGYLIDGSPLAVDPSRAINFKTMPYEPSWRYEGDFQFKKHYFGPKPGELLDKTSKGALTEEFQCAQFIDALPEVEFWVRNLAGKVSALRLQTSTDWFYPDFVCRLTDGRILAIEYKGRHLWADAEEKRLVGAVWESRSEGRCLFAMPTDGGFAAITQKIRPR